jgi:hypothetical protein
MYYLVIMNLDVEKCIDKSKKDIYTATQSYNCLKDLPFGKKVFVRNIKIRCIADPGNIINATVYSG